MRFISVLAAAAVMVALGPADPPRSQTPRGAAATLSGMPHSASGKSSLLSTMPTPQSQGARTPLGTLTPQTAAILPTQPAEQSSHAGQVSDTPLTEVLETHAAQPGGALLSHAAEVPKGSAAWGQLQSIPTDLAMPSQGPADAAASVAGAQQESQAVPGKAKLAPGEKPPRVAEYHWFEGEPKDGVAMIGFGHPKRQRGGEFLVGFTCKVGSGKVTFVMFEAGSSRSQFTKGQKVPLMLEIGGAKAVLEGVIDANEGTSYPRASATIAADDPLFKVMDDDIKVLRIDIDGWSAAVQLILINDVMPAFSKACAKKKKPEASAKAPDPAPAKVAPQ